jgi:hypothetical protein
MFEVEQSWETNRRINYQLINSWGVTLILLIMGLKTLRGALAANLDRVIIRTRQVPQKSPYLELWNSD